MTTRMLSGPGRGRRFANVSVRALMAENPEFDDPAQVVIHRARELITSFRKHGGMGPPFDPEVLASLVGIEVVTAPFPMKQAACLRTVDGRLQIVVSPSLPRSRRNFSICHELVHTFFPDCYERERARSVLPSEDIVEQELEDLCELGAAELLMPEAEFASDLASCSVSIGSIDLLRRQYAASREAVAMRMVRVTNEPCAVAFLTMRLSLTEARAAQRGATGAAPKLRVDFMWPSSSFKLPVLPKHKSVPDTSCTYTALGEVPELGRVHTAPERWATGKIVLPELTFEAMAIPANGDAEPRVAALCHA